MDNSPIPQPKTHKERMNAARRIGSRVLAYFGDQVVALGIYGSLARGDDGPYSDIEMACVMKPDDLEVYVEWIEGPYKVEVDVFSRSLYFEDARLVEGNWSMTHGAMVDILPLHDPGGFFLELRKVVSARPESDFNQAIRQLVVDDIYEMVCKIKNLESKGDRSALSYFLHQLVMQGAWLVGLGHRKKYLTAANIFAESLALPDLPEGYDELVQLAVSGDLRDAEACFRAADLFYAGVVRWTRARGIRLVDDLDNQLAKVIIKT